MTSPFDYVHEWKPGVKPGTWIAHDSCAAFPQAAAHRCAWVTQCSPKGKTHWRLGHTHPRNFKVQVPMAFASPEEAMNYYDTLRRMGAL